MSQIKSLFQGVDFFGYVCGMGAADQGCREGPMRLAELLGCKVHLLQSDDCRPEFGIVSINKRLAHSVRDSLRHNRLPVILGGDHSCALGTWSGVFGACGAMPLLWIDAHMDSHTTQSSPSGNVHGMPLAALLGYGDDPFTQLVDSKPKLRPDKLCLFGVRSFEPQEHALLQSLGVKIIYAESIARDGVLASLRSALQYLGTDRPFGISIDLDAFDPLQVAAVGSPESGGVSVAEFIQALAMLRSNCTQLSALEIAEYNPQRDQNGETAQWILQILEQLIQWRRLPQ